MNSTQKQRPPLPGAPKTRVLILTGGPRSGRAHAIDAFTSERWTESILVVPTRYEASQRAARIIETFKLAGAWGVRVVSFEDFVRGVLRDAGIFPHVIDEFERDAVVRCAIDRGIAGGTFVALGDAARTRGFANHALRVIAKLKQAAVEPAQFRSAISKRERTSWLDPIVADVYDAYQELLHGADAYDRVGVFWRAHVALSEGGLRYFQRVRHVLFDGSDDFTPSEFRVIEEIARYVDTIAFGVACDAEATSQRDLYAVPLETLGHLQQAFPSAEQRSFPELAPKSRIEFVTSQLFWRDKPQLPAGLIENLALQPCHDRMHECEWIGRRIKSLIVEQNINPTRIAVVFRRLEPIAPRLRVVLEEFQIPAAFHVPRTIRESSFARFLLRLFDVGSEWERECVVDAISSRWFGAPAEYAGAYGHLARAAGAIEGKREWTSCVQRLHDWLANGTGERRDGILRRVPNAIAATDSLLQQLAILENLLKVFPSKATRADFAAATLRAIADLQPETKTLGARDADGPYFESNAFGTLVAVLRRARAWEQRLSNATTIALADYAADLRATLTNTAIEEDESVPGVLVMSTEIARYRDYDYLFLGGMNEGEFPTPPPSDAIYSDDDWLELDRAGAKVEKRARQMDREMLLFHHVLGRARLGAVVTWCTASPDGRPLAASPFIDDVKDLMNGGPLPILRATTFLPTCDDASSPRDLRNVPDTFKELEEELPDIFACLRAGLDIELHRNGTAPCGVYDGVLTDVELLAQLAARYGEDHAFSAAQLERYAQCPFQFFLERVLRIEPDEVPDEEFDPRTRGRILHEVLHRFHAAYREVSVHDIPEADARTTMKELCGAVFEHFAKREVSAPRGVIRVEHGRMEAQLLRYLDFARREDLAWKPLHFESGFGDAYATKEDGLTTSLPFPLVTETGTILLSGRIDRVDVLEKQYRIIDYKTTLRYSAKDVIEGVDLQMPLYAVALERFLKPGSDCVEARLVQPGKADTIDVLQKSRGKWPEREAGMLRGIQRAVAGIRTGQFPPLPHNERCYVCATSRVCRHEKWRIERKKAGDGSADE